MVADAVSMHRILPILFLLHHVLSKCSLPHSVMLLTSLKSQLYFPPAPPYHLVPQALTLVIQSLPCYPTYYGCAPLSLSLLDIVAQVTFTELQKSSQFRIKSLT